MHVSDSTSWIQNAFYNPLTPLLHVTQCTVRPTSHAPQAPSLVEQGISPPTGWILSRSRKLA